MAKHGHHGGAWKVAYADFVTAMMALFLCLWLTAQDEKIKQAIERAFRQPFAIGKEGPTSLVPKEGKETDTGARERDGVLSSSTSVLELAMLRRISEDLMKTLESREDNGLNETVRLEMTPEGLRISVFDRVKKPIFEPNSTKMTPYGDWVFSTLAWQISRYTSFGVELEGHTEKTDKVIRDDYTGWELSSDRANASRRKLIENGVQLSQILKVAGYGDTLPMPKTKPSDEVNRRVSVLLKANSQPPSTAG